jgi:hypothetical protein
VEQIFENNLVAQAAETAKDVLLGMKSDPDVPMRPVGGLRYTVRGRSLLGTPDDQLAAVSQSNARTISAPKIAFRRAIALMNGVGLIEAGTFVWETDHLGNRRLFSYQFNTGTLSVHYDAAYVWDDNMEEIRRLYASLTDDYLEGDGAPLGVAIDRLGTAGIRADGVDANLDLCIASEITFLFGVRRDIENEEIARSVREHAGAFFGDGEFFWSRDEVVEILRASYSERSNTVHGRRFHDPDRLTALTPLNAQLREVLKTTLRALIERRPARLVARALWPQRVAAVERGEVLRPMFL